MRGTRFARRRILMRWRRRVSGFSAFMRPRVCVHRRASMYTGLFAFKHRMLTNCDMYHAVAMELPNPGQLLHYRLQSLGYRTGITGK